MPRASERARNKQAALTAKYEAQRAKAAELIMVELSHITQKALPDHAWKLREPNIILVSKDGSYTPESQLSPDQNKDLVQALRDIGIPSELDGSKPLPGKLVNTHLKTSAGKVQTQDDSVRFQIRLPSSPDARNVDRDWLERNNAVLKDVWAEALKVPEGAPVAAVAPESDIIFSAAPNPLDAMPTPESERPKSGDHPIEAINIAAAHLAGNLKYQFQSDHEKYEVRFADDTKRMAFTVTANRVTVHASDNDEVMKDALRIAIKMFDGDFSSYNARPGFDERTVRLIQEMRAEGLPLLDRSGKPLDAIKYNGREIPFETAPAPPPVRRLRLGEFAHT